MKTLPYYIKRYILAAAILVIPLWGTSVFAAPERQNQPVHRTKVDSLRAVMRTSEVFQLHGRMMSSPLPVEISQQGRQLCIKSRYAQLLPIYTASGTYYSSLRLTKGTNWLSGLPRGAYMINNHRYTIN